MSSQTRANFKKDIVVWTLLFAGASFFIGVISTIGVGAALGATAPIETMLYIALTIFFSLPIFAAWAIGIITMTLRYWIRSKKQTS